MKFKLQKRKITRYLIQNLIFALWALSPENSKYTSDIINGSTIQILLSGQQENV